MPATPRKIAANRANAAKSTGPRTPQGKARASQNARKYAFDPAAFAAVVLENPALVANLRDDAIATYQPVNAQEFLAVERIALAQVSILRLASIEAGLFTNALEAGLDIEGNPRMLTNPDLTTNREIAAQQHRAYWAAFGFRRLNHQDNILTVFLRYQAQAERLYRRAIEDFDRLRALRAELPDRSTASLEPISDPANEAKNEPTAPRQVIENAAAPPAKSEPSPPSAAAAFLNLLAAPFRALAACSGLARPPQISPC